MNDVRYFVERLGTYFDYVDTAPAADLAEAYRLAAVWIGQGNSGAYIYQEVRVPEGRKRWNRRGMVWSRPVPIHKFTRGRDGTVNEITEFPAGVVHPAIVGVGR